MNKKRTMRNKRGKRGLSPIIATVLLIAMVMVLASIVFLWARGFISEQLEKFGQPVDRICEQVDFDVELIGANDKLEIVNRGNVDICNFEIKQIRGGDSTVKEFTFRVDVGQAVSADIFLESGTEKIIIFPRVLGSVVGKNKNKAFTCTKEGVTIHLD